MCEHVQICICRYSMHMDTSVFVQIEAQAFISVQRFLTQSVFEPSFYLGLASIKSDL